MMVQIEENSCNIIVADLNNINHVVDNVTTMRSILQDKIREIMCTLNTIASLKQSRIAWYICTGAIALNIGFKSSKCMVLCSVNLSSINGNFPV
jgi:hypothetical protein